MISVKITLDIFSEKDTSSEKKFNYLKKFIQFFSKMSEAILRGPEGSSSDGILFSKSFIQKKWLISVFYSYNDFD